MVHQNFIDGKWVPSETGRTFKSYNPANFEEVVGEFALSSPADVKAAVDAASRAFHAWKH
ncbi:MAG: aldehyde dehydrogenase family protein, partial [Cyanobacteria bacterium]|nr:aldehyde dehydrogenase family protein [Cyanobacteriota bacterium]